MSIQPEIDLWQSDYTMIIIAVLLIILLVFASFSLLYLRLFDRTKIKRIYAAINGAAGALIILMLLPLMGLEITIVLLLLPFVWYITFNFVLYGKPFQPDV
jgi:hypothetical protein